MPGEAREVVMISSTLAFDSVATSSELVLRKITTLVLVLIITDSTPIVIYHDGGIGAQHVPYLPSNRGLRAPYERRNTGHEAGTRDQYRKRDHR